MKFISRVISVLGKCPDNDINNGGARLVTFLNPYSYLIARRNADYYSEFDNIYCDGFLLARLMMLVGKKCSRVSFDMTSLAPVVFNEAARSRKKIFFVGSAPGTVDIAVEVLRSEYPNLPVCGARHGYFSNSCERVTFINELVVKKPDIVVVGMGAPLQEKFLIDLRDSGWKGIGYTCGGFLHQTASGGTQYYPKWMDRLNLRWLYRMIDEPALIRRYFIDYPRFMIIFFFDMACYHSDRMKKG